MPIEYIVTDCDDTLLHDDLTISDYTQSILQEAHRRGIHVILASGRSAASVRPIAEKLNLSEPYIACNGGMTIADGQIIEEIVFSVETARACAAFYNEHDIYWQYYSGEHFYYSRECEYNVSYSQSSFLSGILVGNDPRVIDHPIPKVLGIDTPERIAVAYPLAVARFEGLANVVLSKPFFLELNPLGASKGDALARLAAKLPLTPDNTIVFGDSLNDLSMIRWSNHSVAVKNARDEVKQAARFVCEANNDDGVAKMIEHYVLRGEDHP